VILAMRTSRAPVSARFRQRAHWKPLWYRNGSSVAVTARVAHIPGDDRTNRLRPLRESLEIWDA